MRILIICVAALAFIISTTQAVISEETKKAQVEATKACIEETKVDAKTVEDTDKKIYADDPKLGEYAFCFGKKLKMMNEKGEFIIPAVRDFLNEVLSSKDEIERIVKECTVIKSTPQITSIESLKCFNENLPTEV